MMKRKYFGTNGIRGIIGDLITPNFISKMSSAIAATLKDKGLMVIGSDSRLSSPFIKSGVISSFLASGIEVIDLGMVPTPVVQFAVKQLNAKMGIMVTASHNPAQYNGLKVIDYDGIEVDIKKQLKIEQIFENETLELVPWNNNSSVVEMNLNQEYINQILKITKSEDIETRNLTVVVDAGNGVGNVITPHLLGQLGVKVVTINGNLDGRFPSRDPEPVPEKLGKMGRVSLQTRADFSVAHDGDADRAIFGDEKGKIHYGDRSIALFEKWFMERSENKKFTTPVSSSMAVLDIAEEMGGEVIWTPVGCIYVSRTMLEKGSLLGGEENGGLFYGPHQCVRDGAMAAALMVKILTESKTELSKLDDNLPKYHQKKVKIACIEGNRDNVMHKITLNVKKTMDIIDIDGLKLMYPDGWILIRPSGTEAVFRIFAEAKTETKAEELIKIGMKLVHDAM